MATVSGVMRWLLPSFRKCRLEVHFPCGPLWRILLKTTSGLSTSFHQVLSHFLLGRDATGEARPNESLASSSPADALTAKDRDRDLGTESHGSRFSGIAGLPEVSKGRSDLSFL